MNDEEAWALVAPTKYRMRESAYRQADEKGFDFLSLGPGALDLFALGITFGIMGACDVAAEMLRENNSEGK